MFPYVNNETVPNCNDCTFLKVCMAVIYAMPQIKQIALNFIFTSVYYLEIIHRKKATVYFLVLGYYHRVLKG